MSGLSIWQKSQVVEAIQLLTLAHSSIELTLSADAVDEQEDWEALEDGRDKIAKVITELTPLIDNEEV
jgi:hypothetical protein